MGGVFSLLVGMYVEYNGVQVFRGFDFGVVCYVKSVFGVDRHVFLVECCVAWNG